MLFTSWDAILRLLVVGIPSYFGLVLILRLTGKRTLSQFNAFDFVVTVALGSTLASTLISRQVALVDGLLAFALLVGLQYGVSWTSVRWEAFQGAVKSTPSLLAYEGKVLAGSLRSQRVSREELLAAVRGSGLPDLSVVRAVILETNGKLSVIPGDAGEGSGALELVAGHDQVR